jgi:hypothetical protein
MEADKLLLKINNGGNLSHEEVEEVASLLKIAIEDRKKLVLLSVDDIYCMLLVIGRNKNEDYRHLLTQYLEFEDPLTVSQVLEILCLDWNETEEYLERLINFALGTPKDSEEDIRQTSIKILGEFLFSKKITNQSQTTSALKVLELIFSIFEDEDCDQWTRQRAYYSLLRATGKDWGEIPSECKMLDFSKGNSDINWQELSQLNSSSSESESVIEISSSEESDPSTGIR